jgi:hypothetical protein
MFTAILRLMVATLLLGLRGSISLAIAALLMHDIVLFGSAPQKNTSFFFMSHRPGPGVQRDKTSMQITASR